MPSRDSADFVVDMMHGPGDAFLVRAEWRRASEREALVVDAEKAASELRQGARAAVGRGVGRRGGAAQGFRAAEVGGRLYEALFTGSVRELLGESRKEAELERATWRLCLRFQADELSRVPWELLYQDRSGGSFLAHEHPVLRLPATGRRPRSVPP